jgi:hypothetical protein
MRGGAAPMRRMMRVRIFCPPNAIMLLKSGAISAPNFYAATHNCRLTGQVLHKFMRVCTSLMQFEIVMNFHGIKYRYI